MRTVKADLSNYLRSRSDMSVFDFNDVVDRASRALGRGGILGITTFHDFRYEDFVALESKPRTVQRNNAEWTVNYTKHDLGNAVYVPEKDLLIVKGQRIPTKQGRLEVLGLEAHKTLPEHLSLEDTLQIAEKKNCIIIAPHPFYREGIGPYLAENPHLIQRFDAVEVYNGQAALWIPGVTPRDTNEQALAFYERVRKDHPSLGALTSSNGSSLGEIGRNHSSLKMPQEYSSLRDADDVFRALRDGIRKAMPEEAERHAAYLGALTHQAVVAWDHPIKNTLRRIPVVGKLPLFRKPSSEYDKFFTQKEL